jgi:hypothetical protein
VRFAWRLLAICTTLLTGCSVTPGVTHEPVSAPEPAPASTAPVKGLIHGGQQPLQGARVYLLALSASGYGQPSTSLMLNTGDTQYDSTTGWYYVTTNTTGVFTIGVGDYACTSGQQVYVYSVDGNPQVSGGDNSAAGLMAVIGQCGAGSGFSNLPALIQVNEVTTVAAAYALAGYATDATDMSGSNTALAATGMANAAATAANLANIGSGGVGGTVSSVPEVYTLADILAACVNSSGPGSTSCSTLFSNATADGTPGGAQPTDTATAAINIAHHPGANVAPLYGLATSTAPFQPILSSAPNDWTLVLVYQGNGKFWPLSVAIDGSGNVWATNFYYGTTPEEVLGGTLTEMSPGGVLLSNSWPPQYYYGAGLPGLAIDSEGDAWWTDGGLYECSSSGTFLAPYPNGYTGGGLISPLSVAIDSTGNIWAANNCWDGTCGPGVPSSLGEFSSSGTPISPSGGFTDVNLSSPVSLAIDPAGNVYVGNGPPYWSFNLGNSTGAGIGKFDSSGASTGYFAGEAAYVAIDHAGNIWGAGGDSLGEWNSSGTLLGSYSGGGLSGASAIAIDGAGNVWVTNLNHAYSVSEFSSSGTPISGASGFGVGLVYMLGRDALYNPVTIAIDGSGNIWVGNGEDALLSEIVGAATPVVTPLVTGVISNTLGTRP